MSWNSNPSTSRRFATPALVAASVLFGMMLTVGFDITPTAFAGDTARAVHVDARHGLPSFADLAEVVSPAVVAIRATKIGAAEERQQNPLEFFFNQPQRPGRPGPAPRQRGRERSDSTGSGFLVSPDGYIVTNHHVIEGATELKVRLGQRDYLAVVKGEDAATDLALIKIEVEGNVPFLQMADSDKVRSGDWVVVIGSPLRLDNSVSVGVVSAKGRSINITADSSLENFIQTDAAINFGNSGGPLVNLEGEVIGIATAINFGAENIGFAVPSNTLKSILPQLRERGAVSRGYLGVNIDDLDFDEAQAFGLENTDGALVTKVLEDSPAEKAGLKRGDVILQVDQRPVTDNRDLIDYVASQLPDAQVKVKVFRDGEVFDRKIQLAERPGSVAEPEIEIKTEENTLEWLGVRYQGLSQGLREAHGIPDEVTGVWITDIEPDSPLVERGVQPSDVITEVNGKSVESAGDFEKALGDLKKGGFARLYVQRINPQTGDVAGFFAIAKKP